MAARGRPTNNNFSVTVTSGEAVRRPEATVFMAIDTSGSMSGAKIQAVSSAVKDIIGQCPPYVRFVIRKFDEIVTTLVSKKKQYLDLDRLSAGLTKCGSRTALYDGIGQTINEIPFSCSKLDVLHVLAFTDGEDTSSKNFTLDSMVKLLNEKLKDGNLQFTFIQAGNDSTVTSALETNCPSRCTVLKVEDSVKGIQIGFAKAKENLKLRFVVNVPSSNANKSLLEDLGRLQVSGLAGGSISVNIATNNKPPYKNNNYTQHKPKSDFYNCASGGPEEQSWRSRSSQKPPQQQKSYKKEGNGHHSQKEEMGKQTQEKVGVTQTNAEEKVSCESMMTFPIWVGNVSKETTEIDILEFFSQWGECKIYRLNEWKDNRCAILSYMDEKESQRAIRYGNDNSFFGSKLKVLRQ